MVVLSCSYSPAFTKSTSSSSPKSRASRVARAVVTNFSSSRRRVSDVFSTAVLQFAPSRVASLLGYSSPRRIARPFRRIIRHGGRKCPDANFARAKSCDRDNRYNQIFFSEAHHPRERFPFPSASSLERCSTASLIEECISRES